MSQGHAHAPARDARDLSRVRLAALLTGGFMLVELAGGWIAGSLALLADAAHMLTDTAALGLAWLAFHIARRPADSRRSYGYQRFQVIAAFVNGTALLAIVAGIAWEAVLRLGEPEPVRGGLMLGVALAGLAVNLVVFALLRGGSRANLNVRGALLHVIGDLLGSVAAIAGAAVILATGWMPIDPLLSLLVAALVARSAVSLVRESAHILLEGTPPELDIRALRDQLPASIDGVLDVHHVHAWSLTPERAMVTLHASVALDADDERVLRELRAELASRWGIRHATIQLERGACMDTH